MEEIKVNEYVKTIYGEIFKVFHTTKQKEKYIFVNKAVDRNEDRSCNDNCLNINEIVKHSPNIIDLIEEGDYVNGSRILDITGDYINATEWNCCKSRLEKTIKSIVTKEMFKSVEYRVE